MSYDAIEGIHPKAQMVLAYRSGEFSRVVRDFVDVAKRLVRERKTVDVA